MKKIIILIVVLVIALITAFSLREKRADSPVLVQPINKTYTNEASGYSLSYPSTLVLREHTPDAVTISTSTDESATSTVEIQTLLIDGKAGATLQQSVIETLKNQCTADGPETVLICTEAEQIQEFTSTKGAQGFSLYLKGQLTNVATKESNVVEKGPFYVFSLKSGATASKVVVIHPPLSLFSDQVDATSTKSIAENISVN
jgi:hypothetical protein